MKNMEALNTAVLSLFSAHSGGSDAITGAAYIDFDLAREALLTAHGVTMVEYLDWCEEMEARELAS